MSATSSPLQRRKVDLGFGRSGRCWFRGDWGKTCFLNAYTLLIPEGERFIIRTCKPYMPQAEPALSDELRALFHQEGNHAREHQKALGHLQGQGYAFNGYSRVSSHVAYRLVEPAFPRVFALSTAAAIEHLNASIAAHFLDGDLMAQAEPEMRGMFLWHFAEELEHKEVVYKLLQTIAPGYVLRLFGLVMAWITFVGQLMLGSLLFFARAPSVTGARDLRRLWLGTGALLGRLMRDSFCYCRPGFAPRHAETREVSTRALAAFARLERPAPGPRCEKLAAELTEHDQRVRLHREAFPFYFSEITAQDAAWVEVAGHRKLNFCTYSYLGLLQHPAVKRAAKRAIDVYGCGTHGVRLLGGTLDLHRELERRVARLACRGDAVVFSSGYMANVAALSTLVGAGDFILSDAGNHASIGDGSALSKAEVKRFRHNDMTHLAKLLMSLPADAKKLIVVDAVFSMDGDVTPLPRLVELRDRVPNVILMVDEAHSLGVLGASGHGIEEHFGLPGSVDVKMGTLSKVIPGQGGFIAGDERLTNYLRHHARGYIFSGATPPPVAAGALAAVEVLEREGAVRCRRLHANVASFIAGLRRIGWELGPTESAIVPIMVRDTRAVFRLASFCHAEGLYVMPVFFPAVPAGQERLRANLSSEHSREDIDAALTILARAYTLFVQGRSQTV
jgi:glycine C-acetyltransferase